MDENVAKARDKALSLLTDMDRTERQLSDRLKRAGFSDQVIEETMRYVREYGFVNDNRYAENYLDYYRDKRSKRRIRMDLLKKGASSESIDRAFEMYGDYDERPLILKTGRKKCASLREDDPRRRDRMISFLAGRGFSMSDIFDVVDDILDPKCEP